MERPWWPVSESSKSPEVLVCALDMMVQEESCSGYRCHETFVSRSSYYHLMYLTPVSRQSRAKFEMGSKS